MEVSHLEPFLEGTIFKKLFSVYNATDLKHINTLSLAMLKESSVTITRNCLDWLIVERTKHESFTLIYSITKYLADVPFG